VLVTTKPSSPERKPKLHHAGGFRITGGHPTLFPLIRRYRARYLRRLIKNHIKSLVKAGDAATIQMLSDFQSEILTYPRYEYASWTDLTPLEKQQALFTWIIAQAQRKQNHKYSHLDILAAGLAGLVHNSHRPEGQLRTPYARAVDCGRSIWFLLKPEFKEYEHEDGHGNIRVERVEINRRVRLRSRNAAQRMEAAVMKYAGEFLEKYSQDISHEIPRA
jgi:hypothetical protein